MFEVCSQETPDYLADIWKYAWSPEVSVPYRTRKVWNTECRELAFPIEVFDWAPDETAIHAIFADGSQQIVQNLTVGGWRKAKVERRQKRELEVLWEGEPVMSHNRLVIRQRTDRDSLTALHEQQHQIMQVAVWKFGPLPSPQPRVVDKDCSASVDALAFVPARKLFKHSPLLPSDRSLPSKRLTARANVLVLRSREVHCEVAQEARNERRLAVLASPAEHAVPRNPIARYAVEFDEAIGQTFNEEVEEVLALSL